MNSVSLSSVTVVEFPDGTREYYGSLSAIFERHTKQEIGTTKLTLHHRNVGATPFDTGKCLISKQPLYRCKKAKE